MISIEDFGILFIFIEEEIEKSKENFVNLKLFLTLDKFEFGI